MDFLARDRHPVLLLDSEGCDFSWKPLLNGNWHPSRLHADPESWSCNRNLLSSGRRRRKLRRVEMAVSMTRRETKTPARYNSDGLGCTRAYRLA